jgi:WS/DGAT/MGAT family acyltransferase
MRFARELLWDAEPDAAHSTARPAHGAAAEDDARRRGHLAGFVRREFARSRAQSPFDGTIGSQREVAFADVPFRALHEAAKQANGATVNDAVLSVVAGALRRWIEMHHGALGEVRVRVPVSLHHQGDDAGNRDSFFAVALPLAEPEPVARLRAVHAATAERKADHDADEMDALERELARVSPRLQHFCDRIQASPRRFALNVSNVPGPRDSVSVLGAPVTALHSLAEIGERHALRVAVVSYAGALRFGLCADPDIVHDLDVLAVGIEAEAAELIDAC